jgi:hypothetical protein
LGAYSIPSETGLLIPSDLFTVTKYLKENSSQVFAAKCRDAILNADGQVVAFPTTPS